MMSSSCKPLFRAASSFTVLACLAAAVHAEQVVISEIMHHPPGKLPAWVEVRNQTATPFDIAKWRLTGSIEFEFPDFAATNADASFLRSFERIVISSAAPATTRAAYTNIPSNVRVFGPWVGLLPAGGDRLTLKDKNGMPLCSVRYSDHGRWPAAANETGHTLVLRDGNRKVDDWRNWTASVRPLGTPGAPASAPTPAAAALRLNEIQFAPRGGRVEWIELFNSATNSLPLDGLVLASRADFTDRVSLSGNLPANGCRSWAVPFMSKAEEATVFLADATGTVLDAFTFVRPCKGNNLQAFPDGTKEWFVGDRPTRDSRNSPARNSDIVINEIFFAPPHTLKKLSFVELFNRGRVTVDLTDWSFTDGIHFVFPRGTRLAPGEFLAVAADASRLRAAHGNIPVIGNFQGKPGHDGDLMRLADERGNLVNQVDFHVGGDWPGWTHSGGSSMELIHPLMDNSLSSAWRDSDESAKGEWRTYSCNGVYQQLRAEGAPTDFKELHFHLVSDAHVALRNIQLLKNGSGSNLLVNATRLSTNGFSAAGWLAQGNHWGSSVTNGELHIVADGHGDNRPNRVELDALALNKGDSYEVRFEARWVAGNPRLIAQTWDHSIGDSFLIGVPADLGTPGRRNSRYEPAPAPQVDALEHFPAVPRSTNVVRITVRVASATALPPGSVKLFHRLDSENGRNPWQSKEMFDDGTNGDERGGDGTFTALLPEYRRHGQLAQFYVRAAGPGGQETSIPRRAADAPAMFVIDDRPVPRDLRVARYLISACDYGAIGNGNSPKYGFQFPRLSNHYFNSTFISEERDIYYGAEIRTAGSPWTRGGDLGRSKIKLPRDRAFREHTKTTYDNDPDGGARHHNRLTRYWLYLLGEPVSENEFVRYLINSSGPMLREETEPIGNEFLDRAYPRGHNGDLYRIDDEWWFTDAWGQSPQDADWRYKGSDSSIRYRTEWMKRSNEAEDDYTELIRLFKMVSDAKTPRPDLESLLDPLALAKTIAVRGYIGDWDTFVMHRGKNGYLYRRPTDGRFMFLHWDSDLGFDVNQSFWGGRVEWWLNKSWNRRLYAACLVEMLENYTRNSPRLEAWFRAEAAATRSVTVDANQYRNFCNSREGKALAVLGPNYKLDFKVTSTNGPPLTSTEDFITLSGVAPYGVLDVIVDGRPAQSAEWTSDVAWRLPRVPLLRGENSITLLGVNQSGKTIRETRVVVNRIIPGNGAAK